MFPYGSLKQAYACEVRHGKKQIDFPKIESLGGAAVAITSYISDGVGYAGPLICHFGGRTVQLVVPGYQDAHGNLMVAQTEFEKEFPLIVKVLPTEPYHSKLIFDNMTETDRIDCEAPEYVDTQRVIVVEWSNGAQGAIHFWGCSCFISVFQFDGPEKGSRNINLENVRFDRCISKEDVTKSLLLLDDQKQWLQSIIDPRDPRLVSPKDFDKE